MTVDRQRLEDLAALAAAGAATPHERSELDQLIEEDPGAATEARAFANAASLLALELGEIAPPSGALDRIRETLGRTGVTGDGPAIGPGADIISLTDRKKNRALAIAAASLAAAAVFAFLWWRERSDAVALRDEMAAELGRRDRERQELQREMATELEKARAQTQQVIAHYDIVRAEHTRLANIASESGATMKVFIDPERRRWLVLALKLPPLPSDKDYQLWFVPPTGNPVSAGLLTVGPDGQLTAAPQVPEGLDQVKAAVSVEPKGGSDRPTMDQIKIIGDLI